MNLELPSPSRQRESLEDSSKTQTSQEHREVLFRESARRLALKEKEISELVREHGKLSILESPDLYFDIFQDSVSLNLSTEEIGRENLAYGGVNKTPIYLIYVKNKAVNLSQRVGVEARGDLRIGVYSDIETRDQFLEYAKNAPGHGNPSSIYYFDENGNYGKLQQTNPEFDSGKEYVSDRRLVGGFGETHKHMVQQSFKSQMTPEDFELAGRALDLMKQKLLAALGKNSPPTPDQNTSPSDQ